MKAVILAAGRGTRLGKLTKTTHKSLIEINGRSIIERTLDNLPRCVDQVLLVVGYLGHILRNRLGDEHNGVPLFYVEQKQILGTADALWQAKQLLKKGKFAVLNGDDLYNRAELENLFKINMAVGLTVRRPPSAGYIIFELDKDNNIAGWHRPIGPEIKNKSLLANGAYILDQKIFDYELVKTINGEYSLPHTILAMANDRKVRGFIMDFWLPINNLEDVIEAKKALANEL